MQNIPPPTHNRRLGIITYDFCHLKTEQIVHLLIRRGGWDRIQLFALPFRPRPDRHILIPHRPSQNDAISTEELALKNGLEFIRYDGSSALSPCDMYIVTGAGILPPEIVKGRRIINAHPGIIPSARGLDAFKWSIYDGIELGVTLHYIDDEVDAGEVISIVKTPVYKGDSLATLARRHYELEIDVLARFEEYIRNPSIPTYPFREPHKRMPIEIEAEMVRRFDDYKEKFSQKQHNPSICKI